MVQHSFFWLIFLHVCLPAVVTGTANGTGRIIHFHSFFYVNIIFMTEYIGVIILDMDLIA